MKSTLGLVFVFFEITFLSTNILAFVESDCTEDSTWVDDFVKFECFEISEDVRGYEPTACVPSDEEDGKEYAAHTIFDDGDFRYKCVRIDDDNLHLEKLGCLMEDNKEMLKIGETRNTEKGQYECKQTNEDDVTLVFQPNQDKLFKEDVATTATSSNPEFCTDENGATHEVDSVWDVDSVQLICLKHHNGKFVIKPNACMRPDHQYVHLHTATTIDEHTYACVRDSEMTAHLTKLEVPECFDHEGNPRQVGDYWEDGKFRYRCLVHNNEAVTKIEGVILNRNKRDKKRPRPKPSSVAD